MSAPPPLLEGLPVPVRDAYLTAVGATHREDPTGRVGGPAGNSRLTALTGLVLMVLFLVEGVTLVSMGPLIDVHVFVGMMLVPVAVLKTATTGYRVVRYYTGSRVYVTAGPPPLLLRLLGPLVVLATLALLGTGITLGVVGPGRGGLVLAHQASFVVWLVAIGLHVLGRTFPAARLALGEATASPRVSGQVLRAVVLAATLAGAVWLATVTVTWAGPWHGWLGG